jgi:hypothetical protein
LHGFSHGQSSKSPPFTPQVALLAKVTEARTPENLVELVQEHLGPWKNRWEFRKSVIFPMKNGGITMDDLAKNDDL